MANSKNVDELVNDILNPEIFTIDENGNDKYRAKRLRTAISDLNCYEIETLKDFLFDVSVLISESKYSRKQRIDMNYKLQHLHRFLTDIDLAHMG